MGLFFNILGFLSAVCFGLCTLPSILLAKKRKSTADVSLLFLLMSLIGNLSAASYILYSNIQAGFYQWPQYLNYSVATTLVLIMIGMKIRFDKLSIYRNMRRSLQKANVKFNRLKLMMCQEVEETYLSILLLGIASFLAAGCIALLLMG